MQDETTALTKKRLEGGYGPPPLTPNAAHGQLTLEPSCELMCAGTGDNVRRTVFPTEGTTHDTISESGELSCTQTGSSTIQETGTHIRTGEQCNSKNQRANGLCVGQQHQGCRPDTSHPGPTAGASRGATRTVPQARGGSESPVTGSKHDTQVDSRLGDAACGHISQEDLLHESLAYRPEALRLLYNNVALSGQYNYANVRKAVPSGLNIRNWRRFLEDYNDNGILEYLEYGWPVNFDRSSTLVATDRNHFTAEAYPKDIDYYIQTELRHGALLGPFAVPPVEGAHVSPLMSRPKKGSLHRRIIMDLSFPTGGSVNDGISTADYIDGPMTVRLPTVHDMEKRILELGPGAYIYKTDLARGYRQLRVDPGDWSLLAFKHRDAYYLDMCPPFGMRSSAMMMVRTTNAIVHLHRKRGFYSIAYIDDFGGAEADENTAERALTVLQTLFEELGVQENLAKVCRPAQVLTWLGIQFDTLQMTMSLSQEKLVEIADTLRTWQEKPRATLKEVQSIFGLLQFVTSVAPPARLFSNRILETMREMRPDRSTTLSWGFRRDIKFFQDLIPDFKGVKVMDKSDIPTQHSLELDACLTGCGAICGEEFYGRTFPEQVVAQQHPIAHLELLNIVVAVKVWAEDWSGHRVRLECDNMNSVLTLQNGRARDPYMLHCAREIFYYCARFDIEILVSHAPGALMQRADALSREHLSAKYRSIVENDSQLQRARRVDPDDRLFMLINEL